MHKSKLYDMAGEIAMDKLMPKPVEITISMRGGGGISSLNENIVYRQRGGGDIGIWEGADILGGQSNIPTYNDTGTDDNNATITPVGIGLKPIGQKVESLLPPINKPPFYTPKQAGHIDIETEDRVMERLKEGVPFHLLSPKEQEVGRVMGISPQGGGRPVRGEYDSYFPKYNSRRNVEQGITLPEGMLQQPPVQGGINQFGFVAFGEKIQKDINKRHKTASDPLLNQIAHTSDSIARGELPKDSGEERIRELQDELEIINKQQIKEKQELEKNIRDEKKNMIWGNRKYREAATGGQTMPGGLSGINKTININGQPHSLAWINPGEASALKAMGGSGKKVDGIPAYFDEWSWGGVSDEAMAQADDLKMTPETQFSSPQEYEDRRYEGDFIDHGTDIIERNVYDYLVENRRPDVPAMTHSSPVVSRSDYTWKDPYSDKERGPAGPAGGVPYYGGSDPLTTDDIEEGRYSRKLIPYYNALKERGMSNEEAAAYLSGMGPDSLSSMRESYDTGYSFGGPMGTMQGLSRDQGIGYAKKLKLKKLTGKETKEEKEKYLSDLKERIENLGGKFIPSHKFQGMYGDEWEDTLKSHGFADPVTGELTTMGTAMDWLKPFSMISKAGAMGLNALTSAFGVLGEFITPEGQSYRLMDDGTLVEPDIYADTDEGNVPVTRRPRPRPVQQVSVSEEVEKPLTGIAALQARRPEVASIGQSLQPQFDNLASIFGRDKAAEMLGQPVNIFA